MEYIDKQFTIIADKDIQEQQIVTISDLHWDKELTVKDVEDLVLKINDKIPNYVFILGDICTHEHLNDPEFKKKLLLFFKLLSSFTKTYLIFGNHDYRVDDNIKNIFVETKELLDFYDQAQVRVLNNEGVKEQDLNIIGFNKKPMTYFEEYKNLKNLEQEIKDLILKVNDILKNDHFTILLTHSHIDFLKLQRELLASFHLILAGHTHNGLVPNELERIFPKNRSIYTAKHFLKDYTRGQFIWDQNVYIVNGGVTKISSAHSNLIKTLTKSIYKGEIDTIRIKNKD